MTDPMDARRARAAYAEAWCLYVWVPAIDAFLGGQGAVDSRPLGLGDVCLLPLALAGTLVLEYGWSAGCLRVAHAVKLMMFAYRMPLVWDHECWAALTELSFLFWGEEKNFRSFWQLCRGQLLLLYASAAWWKLNTSFLDPRTSCSTVILTQLLSAYAPHELALQLAPLIVRLAPIMGLAGEAIIAVLLLVRPALGVVTASAFHLLVLLAPAPNFAGGFSVCCAARLLLLLPLEAAARCSLLNPLVVLTCAVFAALVPSCAFGAFGALLAMTLQGVSEVQTTAKETLGSLQRVVLCASFLYAFVLPVLGLQHMASCSMYANLKHYGGSNHLIVPTGLLQDWFGDSSTASSPFDAFGGGLVRVDDFGGVDDLRRNAWSDVEPPRAVQLLTANGHSGRQFAAYYARMDSLKVAGVQSLHVHHPVVMPAFELRRALARSARSDSADSDPSSSVRVVRLPQRLRTPKEWRDFQGVQLHFWPNGSCTKDEENLSDVPCATDDLTLFLPPPWWLRKILLPYPYPLLPEDDTEIHCSS
ncbi:unnamed protein product [Durusdinium trenchii]|uniref:Mannosyltransferase n=1 Tax=Durusdinium trenchii TaxID=1381693 RepID=A0ABP0MJI7_9DINO